MRFGLPPHVCEFPLVLRGPFYDQTQDARRKSAFYYTNIINLDHRLIPPVYRMEVGGRMVRVVHVDRLEPSLNLGPFSSSA